MKTIHVWGRIFWLAAIGIGQVDPVVGQDAVPDRLTVMRNQFEELRADVFSEQEKFEARYVEELKKLEAKAVESGDLAFVLAVRTEVETFGSRPAGVEKSPHGELARMQEVYDTHLAKIKADQQSKLAGLVGGYRKQLEELRVELTKAADIEGALQVQAALDALKGEMPEPRPAAVERPDPATGEPPVPAAGKPGVSGRYVRISLKGNGRLIHLREVEVMSGGKNVATKGTASQSATNPGGSAGIAIDGVSEKTGPGNVSHTPFSKDPWWEVDLGEELPLEEVTIYNRLDDGLHKRLDGFTLSVFDGERKPVWARMFPEATGEIKIDLGAVPPVAPPKPD